MCPVCQRYTYFTDIHEDFEAHHARYEQSEVEWQPGVDVGSWRPILETRINGKDVVLSRKDLSVFRVYPILCRGCRKTFVAHLTVVNLEAVRHYEEVTRKIRPPDAAAPPIEPRWGMRGFTVSEFVAEVKAIKNPVVRASVSRRMRAVMDVHSQPGVSVWEEVPAPPEPDQ